MTTAARKRRSYAPRVPADRRRREILDAALQVVVTRGHSAATMDAVAEQAGVTKPVLYGVFRNRADLLAALLQREQRAAMRQLVAVLPSRPPAGDWVDHVVGGFLAAVQAAPQRWHCVVLPMADMPPEFHAAREHARGVVLRRVELLLGELLSGQPAAQRRSGPQERNPLPDNEILAHSVVSLGEMAARLVLTDPGRFPAQRIAAAARAALGLLAPGPTVPR